MSSLYVEFQPSSTPPSDRFWWGALVLLVLLVSGVKQSQLRLWRLRLEFDKKTFVFSWTPPFNVNIISNPIMIIPWAQLIHINDVLHGFISQLLTNIFNLVGLQQGEILYLNIATLSWESSKFQLARNPATRPCTNPPCKLGRLESCEVSLP